MTSIASRIPVRSRVGTGILIVAALSLGRVVTDHMPGQDRHERPFTTAAKVGQTVHLRTGDVVVTKVDGGKAIATPIEADASPGLWVAIDFTWTPRADTSVLGYKVVRTTTGDTYDSLLGRNVSFCGNSIPGLPESCRMAVEMPPDRMPGAVVDIAPVFDSPGYDSLATVDLGITDETVKKWQARTDVVKIPMNTVGTGS